MRISKKTIALISAGVVLITSGVIGVEILKKQGDFETPGIATSTDDNVVVHEGEVYQVEAVENSTSFYQITGGILRGKSSFVKDITEYGNLYPNKEYNDSSYIFDCKTYNTKKLKLDDLCISNNDVTLYKSFTVQSDSKSSNYVNIRSEATTKSNSIARVKSGETVYLSELISDDECKDNNDWCEVIYITEENQIIKGYLSPGYKAGTYTSIWDDLFGIQDSFGDQRAYRNTKDDTILAIINKDTILHNEEELYSKYVITSVDGRNIRNNPNTSDASLNFTINDGYNGTINTNIFVEQGNEIEISDISGLISYDGNLWARCRVLYNNQYVEGYISVGKSEEDFFNNVVVKKVNEEKTKKISSN